MARETLPRLTESTIREHATSQSFDRGVDYYKSGAILDPVRQGLELRAECEGSEYEPYQLSVTLTQNGVTSARCTCPYDWGGICKHIVALLLTYVHEPESFHRIPPIDQLLANRSREDLIEIIRQMLQREPGLMSVLEIAQATTSRAPMNVTSYRQQARRAMRRGDPGDIESDLEMLRESAVQLERREDWLNAGAIYHVLLAEAIEGYSDLVHEMDYDGDICIVIDEIAQGLGRCLEKASPASDMRQAWLEVLLNAELRDIEIGGIDLAPSAWGAVEEQATDEDWEWIEERLQEEIDQSHGWARQHLVSMLGVRYAESGDEAARAALIRESGTPEQKAYLLIQEGQMDEAVRLMREILRSSPGLVTNFADSLVEAGADDAAIRLVTEHTQSMPRSWGASWLVKYYQAHDAPAEALRWQRQIFVGNPSLPGYTTLREISRKIGQWESLRAEVLEALEQQNRIGLLIEIALEEGDVARALHWLPRASGAVGRYQEAVAKAAEKEYPRDAIPLYKSLAERSIAGRQRTSYHQAAAYLQRVKALHQQLKISTEWENYIRALRTEYKHLPALQDELRKAGL